MEQFLYERETDPEKMLKSLGFGFSPDADVSYGRIPDRFLLSPSSAGGIDLYQFVLHHPDLHHLLWIWDKQSGTQSVSSSSNQSTGKKTGECTSQEKFDDEPHFETENTNLSDEKQNSLKKMFSDMNVPNDVAIKLIDSVPERYLIKLHKRLVSGGDVSIKVTDSDGEQAMDTQTVPVVMATDELQGENKQDDAGCADESAQPVSSCLVSPSLTTKHGVRSRNNSKDGTRSNGNSNTQSDTDPHVCGQRKAMNIPSPEKSKMSRETGCLGPPDSEVVDPKSVESWSSNSDDSPQEYFNVELDEKESLV